MNEAKFDEVVIKCQERVSMGEFCIEDEALLHAKKRIDGLRETLLSIISIYSHMERLDLNTENEEYLLDKCTEMYVNALDAHRR